MSQTITKDLLKNLRADIDAALASVASKYDITLRAGNCRFTETNATFKLEASVKTDGGKVITKDMQALISYKRLLGVTDGHLDTPFTFRGEIYFLAGYKPRSDKFIITKGGKQFVLSVEAVKQAFADSGKPFVAAS